MVEIKYVPTICPYCGTGCGLNFVVKDDKIVGVEPYKRHPVNEGKVCPKGNFGYEFINREDRLTTPLIKENGEFREASWDEALDLVANKLKEVSDEDPNKVGFYACARSPNENIYITQKLARVACGTQNVDHCARICHGPTVAGLATTFGSGAMTNGFDSIKEADYIFCIGSNSMEAHPLFGRKLIQAQKNGAKLVVLDPRYTPTAKIADEYVPFKTGTDVALMNGMIKVIIDNDLQDDEFIKNRTKGFDELKETVQKYDLETVSKITHISPETIKELAIEYASADKAAIVYSLGITEHSHGADNVMSTANLAMLTGNIGRQGTGIPEDRGLHHLRPVYGLVAQENVVRLLYHGAQPRHIVLEGIAVDGPVLERRAVVVYRAGRVEEQGGYLGTVLHAQTYESEDALLGGEPGIARRLYTTFGAQQCIELVGEGGIEVEEGTVELHEEGGGILFGEP